MDAVQILGDKDTPNITLTHNVPIPVPQDSQVLVKVYAAGITADEVGWPEFYRTTLKIPGHDISGQVHRLGPSYAGPLKPGDEIFAMIQAEADAGGQAEYAIASPDEIALKPASISHAQAAALPIPFLTAREALFERANVRRGSRVLVTGASGAVGLCMVQIAARVVGCDVVALASAEKHAGVKEMGANTVVDYNTPLWENAVRDVDVLLDTVGSETLSRASTCVRPNGTVVSVADPPPPWAFGGADKTDESDGSRADVKRIYFIVTARGDVLSEFAKLSDEGKLQPVPVQVFSHHQALEAWDYAGKRGRQGKAVIEFVR